MFLCEEDKSLGALHEIGSANRGTKLRHAIEIGGSDRLKVRLSNAINPDDTHAIDVKYHMRCWVYNSDRVLDKLQKESKESVAEKVQEDRAQLAADIKFFNLLKTLLQDGFILSMASLETTYITIQTENGVLTPCTRKQLKTKIREQVEGVDFSKAIKRNESGRVFLKTCKEDAVRRALEIPDNPSKGLCARYMHQELA